MSGFEQILPAHKFDTLSQILLEWAAVDAVNICLSEKHLKSCLPQPSLPDLIRFVLVNQGEQVILLQAQLTEVPLRYRTRLSSDPKEIITFLRMLAPLMPPITKRRLDPIASLHTKLTQRPQVVKSVAESLPTDLVWQLLKAVSSETEDEILEQRVQALQEALTATESANRSKNDFLATMSHELRTPLTCVIGMSATLLRWSLGPLNDKQRSYLKTIHDSGEHLLELINDILDLSQVEAGKATLSLTEFSLSHVARQCLQVMRDKAISAGVELRTEILTLPERDLFVADQRRFRQILFNLLSNAIKFTPEGGLVTLRLWLENKVAIIQVEDTGIGIPEHKKPLLFQKFQQLDTSYRRSYEGLGLGLALTKQLIEMHHGWVDVDSTEGKGSTFTVEIPMQQLADIGRSKGESPMLGRIALIEDHEETATLICELLTAAGFQVIWMMEPSSAVEQIQLLQPIAAIISANVASMDGHEIIQRLRQHDSTQEIRILLLTPTATAERRQQYLSVGADAYLSHPIAPEHLLQKMNQLLTQTLESAVVS
jgi:two-component system, sensor histidine kinase and response regulator